MKIRAKFRRKLAMLMAICLVLGSLQVTGLTVQASENDGGGISATEGTEVDSPDEDVPDETGTDEDGSDEGVTDEDGSDKDVADEGSTKENDSDVDSPDEDGSDEDGTEEDVQDVDGEKEENDITDEEESGIEDIDSVNDLQTAEVGETYAAEDLGAYGRWNNTPVELTDGKLVLTFTAENEEYCLDLPKTFDMSNCENITIRTADQNGVLAFKVYDGGKTELKAYYGNSGKDEYTFTPDFTGKASCIGVMANGADDTYPYTAQIVSISFVMKDDVPADDTPSGETYAAEDLGAYGRWNNKPVELTDGKLVLTFTAENEEYCLDLPKTFDMSNCENITIRTADQNGVLAFKVYDGGKTELKAYYGNSGKDEYTFSPDFTGKASCIGVMANGADDTYPYTAQIVSISFVMKDDVPADDTPSGETYAAEDLEAYGRWNNTPVELTDGKLVLTFTAENEEYCLDLPKTFDMSNCENITIRTADQNGVLAFKVYDGGKTELKAYYGNSGKDEYTFTPDFTGKASCIGVMANGADDTYPYTAQIVSITFVMKDVPPVDTSGKKVYAAETLKAYGRWSNTPVELTDGKLVLTFTEQYEEFCLDLPETLDMSNCESITIRTADQNGSLAFKVYDSGKNELKPYYGNSGKDEYTFTPDFKGKATCIGIMSDSKDVTSYPFTAQIVSITFVMKDVPPVDTSGKKVYAAETLKAYGRWSNTPVELTDGKLVLTFTEQYEEFCLDLPETLDMSNCESITIRTADQNGSLAFKVYDSGKNELKPYYGNSGKDEYIFTPDFKGKATCIGIMSDSKDVTSYPFTVQIVSLEFTMNGDSEEVEIGDNLIKNPNFADADKLDVWDVEQGSSVITSEIADEAIFDDIKTYGKITKRGSNYNCFAQDITDVVEKNKEYQYTFYVMLDADDYKDQSKEMRTVQMAPYITADGKPNYSCNLTGDSQKVLEPGVWTKFTGTFTPSWTGDLEKVVIRILEQGTEYGSGPGVKGTYYATGVELREIKQPEKEIQTDVPNLKDEVTKEMGGDFIMGVSIVNSELSDDLLMQLVTKHFNAVTLGNELKPDAMFGYSNNKCPGTDTATINGQTIQVPTLDYSRAEKTLDAIYDWNKEHPNDFIRIRGHVLVWHSQTPEWFFHEDYDADKPYVDKDTMNLRLEWYIKTMAEHFTGPGSKYEGMFYGWDVVNEAVSDSTGTYRSDSENSSWWAVYKSNEFILNAFTYANKYMPASVELYYNDYNEWFTNKRNGIVQLLKDVKAKEGARIDGMGMQGHYQTSGTPTAEEFEAAAKAYCEVVGQVQITELDMAASSSYDGTKATLQAEYERQAKRYDDVYTSVRRLKEEGYKVGNITIWGVIDKNSWLQTSSSVGGGTDGTRKQCPLLFDDDYQVKPSYWVFIEPKPLTPAIHKLAVVQTANASFGNGTEQTYTRNGTTVSFVPVWNDKSISVQVKVSDTSKDAEDKVTLYLEVNGNIVSAECLRSDAKETGDGYTAVVSKDLDSSILKVASTVKFDIVVTNGSRKAAYNDTTLNQDTSSEYFAIATLKPYASIPMGTAKVDGEKESSWDDAVTVPLTIRLGAKADAQASLMWDKEYLYVFAEVKDSNLDADNSQAHEKDSLEIFIDENNHKSAGYEDDDKQYRINYLNEHSFNGPQCKEENIESVAKTTDDGYVIEAAIKWTEIKPAGNMEIGIELQINDAEGGKRIGTLSWYDESGKGWSSPEVFGTAILSTGEEEPDTPQNPETPDTTKKPESSETTQDSESSSGQETSSGSANSGTKTVITDWDKVASDIGELPAFKTNAAESGVVTVLTGSKLIVPANVMQLMANKKIVLNMAVEGDLAFSIVGLYIPSDTAKKDLNLTVADNRNAVPAAVIENTCKDAISYRQIPMLYYGDFDTTVYMHLALGMENVGKYANLYRYDAGTGMLMYMDSFRITDLGQAAFRIKSGANFVVAVAADKPMSDYVVVKGDTLSRIAGKHQVRLGDLIKANPQIKNINRISAGDKIYIP